MANLTLTISDVAFGGRGLARADGKVYFVPGTIPGDHILAEITEDHERYATAKVVELLAASAQKIPARCSYFGRCGGCLWQHVPYEQQLLWKQNFVVSALKRIGKLDDDSSISMHGAASPFHYRNRVHLKVEIAADGRPSIGFYSEGSHQLVNISNCFIADHPLNIALNTLQTTMAPDLAGQKFKIELQRLRTKNAAADVTAVIFPDTFSAGKLFSSYINCLQQSGNFLWCDLISNADAAEFTAYDEQFGLSFFTKPGVFQQVNLELNQKLRQILLERVQKLGIRSVLDLFCGSGNLSLPLSSVTNTIVGVEFSERAIQCAKFTAEANNIKNATYIANDAEQHVWNAARKGVRYDLVISDPPREGMYKTNIPLLQLAPRFICYISCDPATLARDLGRLCKQYRIVSIDCFDFFPHTTHVESLVWLQRKS